MPASAVIRASDNERLTTFETTVRFQWKRRRIETLKKDENPNEPTDSKHRSTSFRQYKNDVWNKLQLSILKYKSQS